MKAMQKYIFLQEQTYLSHQDTLKRKVLALENRIKTLESNSSSELDFERIERHLSALESLDVGNRIREIESSGTA